MAGLLPGQKRLTFDETGGFELKLGVRLNFMLFCHFFELFVTRFSWFIALLVGRDTIWRVGLSYELDTT